MSQSNQNALNAFTADLREASMLSSPAQDEFRRLRDAFHDGKKDLPQVASDLKTIADDDGYGRGKNMATYLVKQATAALG